MEKQDLVIGNEYSLHELKVKLIGVDPEDERRVLLLPLNDEAADFYNLNDDGFISLRDLVFMDCFNPKN